ncbi:hypothetical protein DFQ26_002265 [Actinomortierella ambigua]|nr:hypothetical protein DFQ26_002265 [Actinomortierella ambigua]
MTQIESASELAIRSERDFHRFISRKPFRARTAAAHQLVRDHGAKVLPLIVELLATEPLVTEIPVLQPPADPESLNADGGDPNPVTVQTTLIYPQTNSSRRFLVRQLGLTMACSLVEAGVKEAMPLLLEQLNHPSSLGKKQLVSVLGAHASDDELLATTRDSSQATIDSLVEALIKNKRKPISYTIRGKPIPAPRARATTLPLLSRFKADLQASEDFKRHEVWKSYSALITIRRSMSTTTSEEETDEQIKNSLLEFQELYPPLHPWIELRPKQRDPKLADIIVDHLLHFLNHDVQRTMNLVQKASWRMTGDKQYQTSIPSQLWSRRAQDFWNRKQDGTILRDYYTSLINVDGGELVMRRALLNSNIFKNCRTVVVDSLARSALALLKRSEFDQVPSKTQDKSVVSARIDAIISFVALAIENIAYRSKGCSKYEAKVEPAQVVYDTTFNLLKDTLRPATAVLKRFTNSETELVNRLKSTILNKLVGEYTTSVNHACRVFPPLALVLFEEIKPFFNVPERLSAPLATIADNLLMSLKASSESVYDIPGNKVDRPFSSMPPWDNEEVFNITVLKEYERTQGTEAGLFDQDFSSRFNNLGTCLKPSQRNKMATWLIEGSGLHTVLVKKISSLLLTSTFTGVLSNPELRHQFIYPLVFGDLKAEANLGQEACIWASFLDIRNAETRALMAKETFKPSFADRLKWITAILNATRRSGSVREWIETLKWLLPKIRNEIQPNMLLLAPILTSSDGLIPRQYLDNATLDEAKELVSLYLTMDAQNASAIVPVSQITDFIDQLATQALNRFVHDPSHPFFQFGAEIPWRRALTRNGTATALDYYYLHVKEPTYDSDDRNEEEELERRKLLAKGKSELKKRGGRLLLLRVPDGQEETFVQAKLAIFNKRWLEVKDAVITAQQLEPKEGDDLLEIGQPEIWNERCCTLIGELGWRWERSPTLQRQVKRWMDTLESAKKLTFGSEEVLDWGSETEVSTADDNMDTVFSQYTSPFWLQLNGDKLEIYGKYMDLKIRSTSNWAVVSNGNNLCQDKKFEKKSGRTPGDLYLEWFNLSTSAIHISEVFEYLASTRQDLLTDEILTAQTEFRGIFNQITTNTSWDPFVSQPDRLTPHQCELLQKRHRAGLLETSQRFVLRVRHAEAFIKLPITNMADVAEILVLPNLPSRITEALLMYAPTLGEPASTLQVLLAPVYLHSHLARTAIHAVNNALQHVHVSKVADFISPLFPPPGSKPFKVTIQKEALRLACGSMKLFSSDTIQALVKRLWTRTDFHRDSRSVLIQQLIGLLASSEATEEAYVTACETAWKLLTEAARNKDWRKDGITMALLAVSPTERVNESGDIWVSHNNLTAQIYTNTSLSEMSHVSIPRRMIDDYVEKVLLPLTEEMGEEKAMVEVRMLAYQELINSTGWITPQNAATLAKRWEKELGQVQDHVKALQTLLVFGLARCVRPETQHAMENKGAKATVAWGALVSHVRGLATDFMDTSKARNIRLQYLQRIQNLKLGESLLCQNTGAASSAGAFLGDNMDLVQPLLDAGLESVLWTVVVAREIAVFQPKPEWTQDMINEEAFRILVRIVTLGNKYLSDIAVVKSWIEKLFSKADKKNLLRSFIGRKLLTSDPAFADWVHLDTVTLMVLNSNRGLFGLREISAFIERVATCEADMFYRTNCDLLGSILAAELNTQEQKRKKETTTDYLTLFHEVLLPIVERARRAGWKHGPDASLLRTIANSAWMVLFRAFIDLSGEMLHHYIERSLELRVDEWAARNMVSSYVSSMVELIKDNRQTPLQSDQYYESKGITPARVLLVEAVMNGKLANLELSAFANRQHDMPPEVMFAHAFVFEPKPVDPAPGVLNKVRVEKQTKQSMKDMDEYWKNTLDASGGYFKTLSQAVEKTKSQTMSPAMLHTYRGLTFTILESNRGFVLMRPFVYLDFVGLVVTAPDTEHTPTAFATQMVRAFQPVQHPVERHVSNYMWAPPMALALDMAEYLMDHVRGEAELEGHREAQLIEQLTAQFLSNWMRDTVKTKAGGVFAKAEGLAAVEVLKARYNKLVDELCQPASGGYNLALQLPEFEPGLPDQEPEEEFCEW